MEGLHKVQDVLALFKPFEEEAIDPDNAVHVDEAIEAGVSVLEELEKHFKNEMDANRIASKEVRIIQTI